MDYSKKIKQYTYEQLVYERAIIDKEKDNLKQLKQWKKGLLQQMFV